MNRSLCSRNLAGEGAHLGGHKREISEQINIFTDGGNSYKGNEQDDQLGSDKGGSVLPSRGYFQILLYSY